VDVGKLEPGQRVVEEWRGQPVWVVRRTDDMLQTLSQLEDKRCHRIESFAVQTSGTDNCFLREMRKVEFR
jgi:Rieske Fe-S protein